MGARLELSNIVFEFLRIMQRIPALPAPLRPLQGVLIQAAVQTIPAWLRDRIGASQGWNRPPWQRSPVDYPAPRVPGNPRGPGA